MGHHQLDVDDEVFAYLKSRAEPFVDTPNAVLRRILLGEGGCAGPVAGTPEQPRSPTWSAPSKGLLASLPLGTPQALRQILEVTHRVRRSKRARADATRDVARAHNVTPQTVLDKYCRQLELNALQFDQLLAEPELQGLRRLLLAKFPEHRDVISAVLSDL